MDKMAVDKMTDKMSVDKFSVDSKFIHYATNILYSKYIETKLCRQKAC
jgi:hypothetical protein